MCRIASSSSLGRNVQNSLSYLGVERYFILVCVIRFVIELFIRYLTLIVIMKAGQSDFVKTTFEFLV